MMATLCAVCMSCGSQAGRDLQKTAAALTPMGADWWPSSCSDNREHKFSGAVSLPPPQLTSCMI